VLETAKTCHKTTGCLSLSTQDTRIPALPIKQSSKTTTMEHQERQQLDPPQQMLMDSSFCSLDGLDVALPSPVSSI
jgi:hypothetical protein